MKRKELALKLVEEFVLKIRSKPEIEGICLLGGLGQRNLFDKYSDIDIAIFFSYKPKVNYVPPFSFIVKLSNHSFEFNISQLIIPEEYKNKWGLAQEEAYSKAKILLDKNQAIHKLLSTKYSTSLNFKERLIDCLNQYNWKVNIHSNNAFKRRYPLSSNLLINEGIELLISAIFCLNQCHKPHLKWTNVDIERLEFKPDDLLFHLTQASFVKSNSIQEIKRRKQHLNIIFDWLKKQTLNFYSIKPYNYYDYWARNLSKRQIFGQCFFDRFKKKYASVFTELEMRSIKAFLSFHLIPNEKKLRRFMQKKNSLSVVTINNGVYRKIQQCLDHQ